MRGHKTGGYYQNLMYVKLDTSDAPHKKPRCIGSGATHNAGGELPRTLFDSCGHIPAPMQTISGHRLQAHRPVSSGRLLKKRAAGMEFANIPVTKPPTPGALTIFV